MNFAVNCLLIFNIKQSNIMRIFYCSFILCCLAIGCNDSNMVKNSTENKDSVYVRNANKKDVLVVNMDTTIDPSQDFFMYANGGWIKNNPIPPAYGSWGIGNLVVEENRNRLREISEKADSATPAKGTTEQKIGDFWATAMDSARIERQGLQPLKPYLDKINGISDISSLVETVAELKKIGSSTLFGDF